MNPRKPWNSEEEQLLRDHYNRGARHLVALLDRSWAAIQTKAQKLGVRAELRTSMKTCPRCQRSLPRETDFYERKNGRHGTRSESWCKECCSARAAKRLRDNPSASRARNKRRHLATRDAALEYMRQRNVRFVTNLEPRYVARTLGLLLCEAPAELLELKRAQLLFKRSTLGLHKAIYGEEK